MGGGNTIIRIKQGQLWQVGDDLYLCGDHENQDLNILLDHITEPIDMIYSDPPWNAGNCRYWRTIAHRHTGEIETHDVNFNWFWDILRGHIKQIQPRVCWIEMSVQEHTNVIEYLEGYAPPYAGKWTVCYGSPKRPNILLRFSSEKHISNDPTGLSGESVTEWAFNQSDSLQSQNVLDFCIGLGMTSRFAYKFDKTCYGMELNPTRLEKTIEWISKKTGLKPELLKE
jgi:hypothetical protein